MGENDTSKQDPLAAFDASESAEQSQESENSFTKPSEGSFSTLSSDQADITEYQET